MRVRDKDTMEPEAMTCACPSSRLERFAEACLLLVLQQEPSHGYQLVDRLKELGLEEHPPDPTVIYRTLRRMEQDGFVKSEWLTDGPGPARRLYHVTPEGEELLHAWAITVRKNKAALERFLKIYQAEGRAIYRPAREEAARTRGGRG